ncbi:hypothetical protein [Sphingopyxis indica]|uniref:hypothetical protein n=1 Tax=Sphingopyxis indica TaxID=436663 RepID=UPI001130D405|nr:hypothetical protein [Sphingopyxis indica]
MSILEQVERDATAAADERWRNHVAQLEFVHGENEYWRGLRSGLALAPSRWRWWLFGLACGAAIVGVLV